MTREMLRAKVHRITVTECDVEYEGSLTLDRDLMDACGMLPFERIDVYDVDNASRFSTYLIEGPRGSGACCVNGAAARLVGVGHKVIVAAYAAMDDDRDRDASSRRSSSSTTRNRITAVKTHEGAGVRVGARMNDPTIIRTFSDRGEAEIARSLLEAEGIDAATAADDTRGNWPQF